MKTNNFFNFEFGVVKDYAIAMSPFGLAVKNSTDGAFQAYDKTTGNVVNVDGFTFKINGAFFKMPVAIDSIQIGDMLMVNGSPVYVIGKDVVGVAVIDLKCSEKKTIMPTTNIFGFNYMTKVVSMFDNFCGFGNTAPSKEQPFGNLAPLMMMQMFTGDDNDFDFDFNGDMGKMMMMSMMMGGQNPFMNMFGAAPIPTPTVNTDAIKRQAVNAGKAMRGIVSDSVEIDPNFQTPNLVGLGGVDIPDGTNIEVKMTKATTQN